MKSLSTILTIISAGFFLSSCEKVIQLDLPDGEKIVYTDAWITDKPGTQTIRLLRAVNYQDQSLPTPVADANIKLVDITAAKTYNFIYNNGSYTFNPAPGQSIGLTGHAYKLEISMQGEVFEATDVLPRVTAIDSLVFEYKEGSGDFEKEGFYAELHATDLAGATDYYWIRTYRNGARNSYLNDMVSIDGSFYEGISDGYKFITPFQEGVTSGEKPYQKGDEVKVVLRSLSKSSYGFMEQTINQLANGGLFSQVLQNIPTNIRNTNAQSSLKIYGWFGTVGETSIVRKAQ
jgi:uncharacterized protein DUF4249